MGMGQDDWPPPDVKDWPPLGDVLPDDTTHSPDEFDFAIAAKIVNAIQRGNRSGQFYEVLFGRMV